jgi:arsenite methyltransferase
VSASFDHDSPELAQAYDCLSDSQLEGGKRLVVGLGVQAGDRVLDIGCGTGRLTRWIAERVGPAGGIVGVDPLPERIAIARAHAPGVSFEVGRAEDLGAFSDGSFDVVCMAAVLHWVADRVRALAEVRRVLRPGGLLGVTTLSRELLMAGTAAVIVRSVVQRSPYRDVADPSAFSLASHGFTTTELIALVAGAGLEVVEVGVKARTRVHTTGETAVAFLEASSFGNLLRIVPEALRPALRADLAASFEERRGPDGIPLRDWGTALVARRTA